VSRARRSTERASAKWCAAEPGPRLLPRKEGNRGPGSAMHRSTSLRAAPRPGHVLSEQSDTSNSKVSQRNSCYACCLRRLQHGCPDIGSTRFLGHRTLGHRSMMLRSLPVIIAATLTAIAVGTLPASGQPKWITHRSPTGFYSVNHPSDWRIRRGGAAHPRASRVAISAASQ
jgi:hypothetical protein